MQRHPPAAAHALLVVCAFGASLVPATAQTPTGIEREVREGLRGERDLRRLDVTVAGSEVTLTGELETFWSKSEAIRRTLEVDGVETVVSEIALPPAESDQKLVEEVVKAMQRYAYYTVFDYLDGRINAGVVTLMGKVTPERDKAGELFERVAKIRGVQDVQNQIETMTPSSGDDNCDGRSRVGSQQRSLPAVQHAVQPAVPHHRREQRRHPPRVRAVGHRATRDGGDRTADKRHPPRHQPASDTVGPPRDR